jgi:hypothetical protein
LKGLLAWKRIGKGNHFAPGHSGLPLRLKSLLLVGMSERIFGRLFEPQRPAIADDFTNKSVVQLAQGAIAGIKPPKISAVTAAQTS